MNEQRLDKIISSQFNLSRSVARKHIGWGRVTVNGKQRRDPSEQFDPDSCHIEYSGQALNYKEHIYIIMNKPSGVLCASNDKSRQTVIDLIGEDLKRNGLFPVGRLDKDTTGLLLITDDGDFSHKVIHPKKRIAKVYKALLDTELNKEAVLAFSEGITLADGEKCRPSRLTLLGNKEALVEITEGKYHQIKRMFGTVGAGVCALERISIGALSLPADIEEGSCRELTDREKELIFL